MSARDPLLPNALIVARREYVERVRSRLFHASTVLLAALAVLVAFAPLFIRIIDQGTVTRVAVVADSPELSKRTIAVLDSILNGSLAGTGNPRAPFVVAPSDDQAGTMFDLGNGLLDAAIVARRGDAGRLSFQFHVGQTIGDDRLQQLSIGAFGVAVLDYSANNPNGAFQMPDVELLRASVSGGSSAPLAAADYAGRRILGIVFVFIIFLTIVIYGMWVAAGVVTEKTSRVMELMISAASARQLVVGKVVGIGLAGLTQYATILVAAIVALALEDRVAHLLLGPANSLTPSFSGVSVGLLLLYGAYFVLGFTLYALVYAAAGSLVSRAEDLQVLALPLSLVAIGGYLLSIGALTGGSSWIIRLASYVPFWSPFVMLPRLTVGRVEAWEVVLSFGLLVATIGVTYLVAVRIYAAGVLLYGQRPGLRALAAAARGAR
ncbi:MAG TPA: ABC transporter permease [Candidatus Limnocylindrales bacterium]|jgi:ABC-2 type transport system permease protein|nr:ABC transporter permease [Candidatus Limnocylindrales bacterium]